MHSPLQAQDVWPFDTSVSSGVTTSGQKNICSTLIRDMDIMPFVQARAGEVNAMQAALTTDRDDVESIRMQLPDYLSHTLGDTGQEWVAMRDDGEAGDLVAGDGIFSIGNLFIQPAAFRTEELYNRFGFDPQFEFTFDDGSVQLEQFGCRRIVFSYDPSLVEAVDLVQYNDTTQASPHVVNVTIPHPGRIGEHEVSLLIQSITNAFYERHPDDRDFLLFPVLHPVENAPPANFWSVKQSIAGLGYEVMDRTDEFGSAGQLKGIIRQYNGGLAPRVVVHEYLHYWAAFLPAELELTSPVFPVHWEFIDRPDSGFGPFNYSADIQLLTDSTFSIPFEESPVWRYSDLELYLMGLIPPEEVASPIRVFVGSQNIDFIDDGTGGLIEVYKFERIRDVTMEEIVSTAGVRVPDFMASQKSFKTASIIMYDRPLLPEEMFFFDLFARVHGEPAVPDGWLPAFDATFEEATYGMAQMETRLREPLSISTRTPVSYNERALEIFPNPARQHISLDFTLAEANDVTIVVVDLLGRVRMSVDTKFLVAGAHNIRLNTSGLQAGTYAVRVAGKGMQLQGLFTRI